MSSRTTTTLTEAEFHARFPLIPNHLHPTTGWSVETGPGCLFQTYGQELAFIRRQDERCVWTLIESHAEHLELHSGFRSLNCIGFLLSRVPVTHQTCVQIRLRTWPASALRAA